MYRLDPGLKAIIEAGRKRGFVTVQQVHAWLPDVDGDPAMVDSLIIALDESNLDFIEDPDIQLDPEPVEEEVKQAQAEKAARAASWPRNISRCRPAIPSACISVRWATYRSSPATAKSSSPSRSKSPANACVGMSSNLTTHSISPSIPSKKFVVVNSPSNAPSAPQKPKRFAKSRSKGVWSTTCALCDI
ncbi:MAG UNVERIFIED_CONTAM: RNA polymerase sigma factor region1.1 domain-containing protein [Planctomycetaceae bacterium]